MSTNPDPSQVPLLVIGGGTMGAVIVEAGLASGILHPAQVVIAEPDKQKYAPLTRLGVRVTASAREALPLLPPHAQILLAIKPQSLVDLAQEMNPALASGPPRTVITILAGTPTSRVASLIGHGTRVVRAMPNTPAKVRRGMTAIAIGSTATHADAAFSQTLFNALGQVVRIDEDMMDAFTAVAGSGPAYIYYLSRAMVDAAISLGFDPATAQRIVTETVAGSGALLSQSSDTPDTLLKGVQSKGGTTEAAIRILDSADTTRTIIRALTAARDRGRELALG